MERETHIAIAQDAHREYSAPVLTIIGDMPRVVLGLPGGGFDGPYGMSEPAFEFEPDAAE